jgi:hypothetical protein
MKRVERSAGKLGGAQDCPPELSLLKLGGLCALQPVNHMPWQRALTCGSSRAIVKVRFILCRDDS